MGWQQLIDMYREARDQDFTGEAIEREVCPNDGEPLKEAPDGLLFCPFDGYRLDR